jgi:hypothetical protein
MKVKTWIVYKASSAGAAGWEDRMLQPGNQGTDILWENWGWSDQLPQIGDRTRVYANLEGDRQGVTHGKPDHWVVVRMQQFKTDDADELIVVCHCAYSPIDAPWQPLNRKPPMPTLAEMSLL